MATSSAKRGSYTVPGMDPDSAATLTALLQDRLTALTDLHLTLKHVHWNVVGPHFIAVHEMIDPQVDDVRAMTDEIAERIATLGGSPVGTMGAMVQARSWDDYSLRRAGTAEHLGALDVVYQGVVGDHREAIEKSGDLDPVSEDMLIAQAAKLELFHWFVRAHLESSSGELVTGGERTEKGAAEAAGELEHDED
ncbi:Dps family protein [Aquipuribacter sp. SD81]|uniref:Dps family protein n=1 Tax=Aquipuribacter sp. SD81 TaxID=3127703 RepID=UPI003FA57625